MAVSFLFMLFLPISNFSSMNALFFDNQEKEILNGFSSFNFPLK